MAAWLALGSSMPCESASVTVDVAADRRAISPLIYGVNWASPRQLRELNSPLNRYGGNSTSRYNWRLNASNRGRDWFYESTPEESAVPGERADRFIRETLAGGATPMITIPMLEWVARLGPGRAKLASFSIAKYGPQQARDDQWFPDAGNGLRTDGSPVRGNDPQDAHVRAGPVFQQPWVERLVTTWGAAARGGIPYYILDNEPSLWHANHRDVHPAGTSMDELRDRIVDYARRIKSVDPGARVVAPEEWGWTAYFRSGRDQQWGSEHGWSGPFPDRSTHGDWPYLPWLLRELAELQRKTGRRLLDVFSVHYYPQGGESSDDVSTDKQLLRARSTRSLWDPLYVDESWIADRVVLIPRLHAWVDNYYPGTAIAITEYDWGAERHISGALAQADVLGIFGREGVALATRWEAPAVGTPVYRAFQLYRNYDGAGSTFGDVSVRVGVENPDRLAAFAAERSSDGALTVILLNKSLQTAERVTIRLTHFSHRDVAHTWQLTAANEVLRLPNVAVAGDRMAFEAPAQSATLLVLPRRPGRVSR